jgi:LmbE family N-acetylglucosaminyl deacetylase
MGKITRRDLIGQSALLMGSAGALLPLPGLTAQTNSNSQKKLKIVIVGGHPDDPESGCGGTAALYADHGHDVVLLYLTRGERGIDDKTLQQAATVRTAEAEKACAILKTRPVFAGQIDGDTELNKSRYSDFRNILDHEHPDLVLTHWPIDTHRDHRAASLLVYDAWLNSGRKFDLYYYEVMLGEQSQVFQPTHYVDITAIESRKRAANMAHSSQSPETAFYPLHEIMHRFRGMESGVKLAEAFVRHPQNPESGILEI